MITDGDPMTPQTPSKPLSEHSPIPTELLAQRDAEIKRLRGELAAREADLAAARDELAAMPDDDAEDDDVHADPCWVDEHDVCQTHGSRESCAHAESR